MTTLKPTHAAQVEYDHQYHAFEAVIRERVANAKGPLFTTEAGGLFDVYLDNLPANRQHYNCNCCRRFVEKYGGLVTIDERGNHKPLLWDSDGVPLFFLQSAIRLKELVKRAKVTGVFLTADGEFGVPRTGEWSHLSGKPSPSLLIKPGLKTPGQLMAERREEYGMLRRGLAEYRPEVVVEALRVLKADALDRSEKTVGVAEWLAKLQCDLEGVKGARADNIVWRHVAEAPPGFCHVKTTMISPLMDDIKAGLSFAEVSKRWADKMHPLKYQRPQAAPKTGQIEAAERLFQQTGAVKSLERRYATLDDVQVKWWVPTEPRKAKQGSEGGFFMHLRPQPMATKSQLALPATTMTFEKFVQKVLPAARKIELYVGGGRENFYGLLTATHPDAPPILQWDGLEGQTRNPVSWYLYHGGSPAVQWGLSMGWREVTAVFPAPPHWQKTDSFSHQREMCLFALAGAKDTREAELCLFPEILKNEYRAVRSVIEAHSKGKKVTGREAGNANGLALEKGFSSPVRLKVTTDEGVNEYTLDRWE